MQGDLVTYPDFTYKPDAVPTLGYTGQSESAAMTAPQAPSVFPEPTLTGVLSLDSAKREARRVDALRSLEERYNPESSVLGNIKVGLGAAASAFDTYAVYKMLTRADYLPEPDFKAVDAFKARPEDTLGLDFDTVQWLHSAKSTDEFNDMLDRVVDQRKARETAGDLLGSPAAFAMTLADPIYFAAGVGGAIAGRAIKVGALGAAATDVAAIAGTQAALIEPARNVSTEEYALGALLTLGAHAIGSFKRGTPDTPTAQGTAVTEVVRAEEASIRGAEASGVISLEMRSAAPLDIVGTPTGTPKPKIAERGAPLPEESAYVADLIKVSGDALHKVIHEAAPTEGMKVFAQAVGDTLDKLLATGNYKLKVSLDDTVQAGRATTSVDGGVASVSVLLNPNSTGWVNAMHELTHAALDGSIAHAAKINSKLHKRGLAILDLVRNGVKTLDKSKFTPETAAFIDSLSSTNALADLHELIAWTTDANFRAVLGSIKSGKRSALSAFAKWVGDLLGIQGKGRTALHDVMQLADEHMQEYVKLASKTNGELSKFERTSYQELGDTAARQRGEFSLYKYIHNLGPAGAKVARLLLSDPVKPSSLGAASWKRTFQLRYALKADTFAGFIDTALGYAGIRGKGKEVLNFTDYTSKRRALMDSIAYRVYYGGIDPNPVIAKAVDSFTDWYKGIHKDLRDFGLLDTPDSTGDIPRRIEYRSIVDAEARLGADVLLDAFTAAHMKASPKSTITQAKAYAKAIIERAKIKGYGDAVSDVSLEQAARERVLQILQSSNLNPAELLEVERTIFPKGVDGLGSFLEPKIPLDMLHALPDGSLLMHLYNNDLVSLMHSYSESSAGVIALNRVGITTKGQLHELRSSLARDVNVVDPLDTVAQFDDIVNNLLGAGTGERVGPAMQMLGNFTDALSLKNMGLYQLMDTTLIKSRLLGKMTYLSMLRQSPELRAIMQKFRRGDAEGLLEASELVEALAMQHIGGLRLRSLVDKHSDGFVGNKSATMRASEVLRDFTSSFALHKYVMRKQTLLAANYAATALMQAARSVPKYTELLNRYGASAADLLKYAQELAKHGTKIDKWHPDAWDSANRVLNRMMDDAVLADQLGEVPAFITHSTLGKFLFKYRRFSALAHNKLLVREYANGGVLGVAGAVISQYPTAMLVTAAVQANSGRPINDIEELAKQTFTTMSSLGWLTEIASAIYSPSTGVGTPALGLVNRLHTMLGDTLQGDLGGAAEKAARTAPILSVLPAYNALLQNASEYLDKQEE